MNINYARLHSPTFVPGLGTIKDTLDKSQFSTIKMTYTDSILTVTAGKPGVKNEVTFLVPITAVAMMTSNG